MFNFSKKKVDNNYFVELVICIQFEIKHSIDDLKIIQALEISDTDKCQVWCQPGL